MREWLHIVVYQCYASGNYYTVYTEFQRTPIMILQTLRDLKRKQGHETNQRDDRKQNQENDEPKVKP